jgi:N-acetylmuramoyl-L-alanine amidase
MEENMNKKLLLFLTITLLFLVTFPQSADLAAADMGMSNDYYLLETVSPEISLRSGADDKYKVKTIIPKGQKVVVISGFVNSKNEQWLHVQYNHFIGWMKDAGVLKQDIRDQFFTSSSAIASIRRGALTTYQQVGTVQRGQLVKVIAGLTNGNGEKWIRIENGKTGGWVPLSSMELFDGGENYFNKQLFIKQDAQVRNGASNAARAVFTLKKGKLVTIQSSIILNNVTWYRINDGVKTGWIQASTAADQLDLSTYIYVINQSADVRRGADSSYKTISKLTIGQKVKTTTQFISGDGQIWYKVNLGNGKNGWVLGKYFSTKQLKIAYLTIDDGPSIYTGKLLDTLTKYRVKATFL